MAEFPIDSNDRRAQYGASAGQTAFPYDFPIFAESEITVYRTRAGATSTLALATDYAVSGVGAEAGGNVTLAAGALAGDVITILGTMPNARSTDFQEQGDFRAEVINRELDRLTIQIQELRSKLGRAVRQPDSDGADIATLPPQAARAGMLLGFDANGDPTTQVAALPGALTALAMPRVNAGASAYELRTPGEVLGDIGAQPLDATLSAFGALAIAADTLPYGTGADAFATAPLSAFARSVLDDPDAPAARTTLGLGTLATQSAAAVAITGGAITGIGTPSASTDVANKQYVDSVAAGVSKRGTVRVATTANVNLANGLENGDTLDGVVLASGDVVLVKNQSAPAENGVYTVPESGSAARAVEFDTYDEHPGAFLSVQEGTTNADSFWICTSNVGGTLNATAITFAQVDPGITVPVPIAQGGTGATTENGALANLFNGATAETTPAIGDMLGLYDASAVTGRKMTFENALKVVGSLTQLAAGSVDTANDKLLVHDQSVPQAKYITVADLLSLSSSLGRVIGVQVFNSSGTWTRPAGCTAAIAYGRGGGGGGGSVSPPATSGGGGQGGFCWEYVTSPGVTETITVGGGGGAAAAGGNTSFGAHWTANGGGAGGGSGLGGGGGGASGGSVNIRGENGCHQFANAGGHGGGEGSGYGQVNANGGAAAANTGGGGGGTSDGSTSRTGGAGGSGYVIVIALS